MAKNKDTTIRIRVNTKFELDEITEGKESYNDTIMRLIKLHIIGKPPIIYFLNKVREILKRYFIYCEECDIKRAIQVHHKDTDKKNNKLENLMMVCKICHKKIHYPSLDWNRKKYRR